MLDYYGAKLEAARRWPSRDAMAAALRAILAERDAAIRALIERQQVSRTMKRVKGAYSAACGQAAA